MLTCEVRLRAARLVYGWMDSPVGRLLIASGERGIRRVAFAPEAERLLPLLEREGGGAANDSQPLEAVMAELRAYFQGYCLLFTQPLDLSGLPPFQRRVLQEATAIPSGTVTTYGALAERVGCPHGARAVGTALARNPVPILVPCHRVVPSHGGLGGYAGGQDIKRKLLALEIITSH